MFKVRPFKWQKICVSPENADVTFLDMRQCQKAAFVKPARLRHHLDDMHASQWRHNPTAVGACIDKCLKMHKWRTVLTTSTVAERSRVKRKTAKASSNIVYLSCCWKTNWLNYCRATGYFFSVIIVCCARASSSTHLQDTYGLIQDWFQVSDVVRAGKVLPTQVGVEEEERFCVGGVKRGRVNFDGKSARKITATQREDCNQNKVTAFLSIERVLFTTKNQTLRSTVYISPTTWASSALIQIR